MSDKLPDDWLARVFATVDDEVRRWPKCLKDSYFSATGQRIGPDPRDEKIAELEAQIRAARMSGNQ